MCPIRLSHTASAPTVSAYCQRLLKGNLPGKHHLRFADHIPPNPRRPNRASSPNPPADPAASPTPHPVSQTAASPPAPPAKTQHHIDIAIRPNIPARRRSEHRQLRNVIPAAHLGDQLHGNLKTGFQGHKLPSPLSPSAPRNPHPPTSPFASPPASHPTAT
jgi:hypothetical protein